ncbi:unnamed protein product [Spirodela intermedia]|uniref:BAH domain-containing protein n=1 Tax=Spirodela intermedia TaxID=51605 RepID=A0A7I8IHV5_SPIIN|nr:unnamed protein product [Spirodela intermedia]CAA6657306.1 unnamed protein product [Spirodela intermedia]
MLYVVAEEFLQAAGIDKSAASCLKWRSRREVVDWLKTFLPSRSVPKIHRVRDYGYFGSPITSPLDGINDPEAYLNKNVSTRNLRSHNSDIFWSGVSWTCSKQLKHYKAFCRNGTTIAIHSFVVVMSEGEENHYLAYLEDMYEDKKGQKKVRVRWFHQNQEVVGSIPPPTPHPREVFITPYMQVISAECLDDLATVLTPEHYDKCLANLPKNKFKPFDLSTLHGYFDQSILACLDICISGEHKESLQRTSLKCLSNNISDLRGHLSFIAGGLSIRSLGHNSQIAMNGSTFQSTKFGLSERKSLTVKLIRPFSHVVLPFKVDEKVELLCQDSGIRGCWFRCTVLQLSQRRLKVRYDDLTDEDGFGNLEEWVPIFRRAAPCKLEIRHSGRLMIRPCRPHDDSSESAVYEIGSAVDAWRNDGWWEGLVIGVNDFSNVIKVYFPGEDKVLDCPRSDLRISKDWIKNDWVNIEAKPLALPVLSSIISGAQASSLPTFTRATESGSSEMSDHDAAESMRSNSNEGKAQTTGGVLGGIVAAALDITKVYSRKRRRDEDGIKLEGDNGKDIDRMGDGHSDDSGRMGC